MTGKRGKKRPHTQLMSKASKHIIRLLVVCPLHLHFAICVVYISSVIMNIHTKHPSYYNIPSCADTVARYYFICCRSGKYLDVQKSRKHKKTAPSKRNQKNYGTCISRMYVDELKDGGVNVT